MLADSLSSFHRQDKGGTHMHIKQYFLAFFCFLIFPNLSIKDALNDSSVEPEPVIDMLLSILWSVVRGV